MIGEGNDGGGVGENDMYSRRVEPVLVLSSNLYSDEEISVGNSRPSSCPAYTVLLTTLTITLIEFYMILS